MNKWYAGQVGERLSCEVISRRAEAAGCHNHIGPLAGLAKHEHVVGKLIADRRMEGDGHTDFQQALGEPLAVGVESLAGSQLVADGDDFGTHDPSAFLPIR